MNVRRANGVTRIMNATLRSGPAAGPTGREAPLTRLPHMHVGWGQAYALAFGKWIEDSHRPVSHGHSLLTKM